MAEGAPVDKPPLVLGGRGTAGRRVVQRLTAHGPPVQAGSRPGRPPSVPRILGRAPRDPRAQAAETAATGAWNPPAEAHR